MGEGDGGEVRDGRGFVTVVWAEVCAVAGTMQLIPDGRGGTHASQVLCDEHFVSDRDKPIGIEVRGGFPSGGIDKLHALASVTGDASRLWHFRFGHFDADAFRRACTQ